MTNNIMDKMTADVLQIKYKQGERNFANLDLSHLDLQGINLREVDLRNTNLQKTNLSYANLSESCLDGANLDRSNLTEAKLNNVSLQQAALLKTNMQRVIAISANFNGTKIINSQLQKADLTNSSFTNAYLTISHFEEAILHNTIFKKTDVNGAYFQRASFHGADLTGINLIRQAHLKGAVYDESTQFNLDVNPAELGMEKTVKTLKVTIEELLAVFNSLTQCSNRYLGSVITIQYWQSSRPDIQWLEKFQIDKSARISFLGEPTELINTAQFRSYQIWSEAFIKSCSQLIQDFSALIK
jgi:uncharacterized protein YjbI with pentapeptide repeats